MLAASSLSALSHSVVSTGYSESVDLDLVDEIIERSPRTATAFPLVYKAYVSVLEDNDLSPANDTAYYQFLLKLQVIRAGTWGEKWDVWRATNLRQPVPGNRDRLSASPKLPNTSRLNDVRSRVPFLAGASSDLDEAFGDTSYSADGESVASSEPAVGYPHRLDSRKRRSAIQMQADEKHHHSRSLVGYTPDPSLDVSHLSLDLLPARTSTPVNAQYRGFGPTPPPYSVSETPVTPSEQYNLTEEDTILIEGLATPRASARDWEEQQLLEEEVIREMERRADQFRETGLLGRCFDVWVQANDWIQQTTHQIDTVRANILLRQSLHEWRDALQKVSLLPQTADRFRTRSLQTRTLHLWVKRHQEINLIRREAMFNSERMRRTQVAAFGRWRAEVVRRTTQRWEKDMRAREKHLLRQREEVLLKDVLDRWRGETQTRSDTRRAVTTDRQRLLRQSFEAWYYRLEQKERLEGQLAVFCRSQERKTVEGVWTVWMKCSKLNRVESEWYEKADLGVTRRVWDQWRVMSVDRSKADIQLRKQTLVRALHTWTGAFAALRAAERKADIFRQVGDQIHLRSAWSIWVVRAREALLVRVRQQRLLKEALSGWRRRVAAIGQLEGTALSFHQARSRRTLHRAVTTWRSVLKSRRSQQQEAAQAYDIRRLSSAMSTWRRAAAKIRQDRDTADKARAFFVLRQVLKVWKAEADSQRQERFVAEKELDLSRAVFTHWRFEAARSVQDRRLVAQVRTQGERRVVAKSLAKWTERVIALKSRQLDISEQRDRDLQQSALERWLTARKRVADLGALSDSFLIVKGEDRLRAALAVWKDNAVRKRRRREVLLEAERARKQRLLEEAWSRWRGRLIERRLVPLEEEVGMRHEDAILFHVWDRWKAKATQLPAISYDNRRTKKKAWASWRRALERSRMSKEFGGPRDRRLLEDIFQIWRAKTEVKVVSRAGRVRGRLRPSLPPAAFTPHNRTNIRTAQLAEPARPPSRTSPHVRSQSQHRHIRTEPASPRPDDADLESVYSEPAYSRLRSELTRPGARGASDEGSPPIGGNIGPASDGKSALITALRGGLARR